MALADYLGQFLKSFGSNAQNQFSDLSTFDMFGSQGLAQKGEAQRQAAQLAQQLKLHNTMTPYETAQLALSSDSADAASQQRDFENRRQMGEGVAQGLFQPAKATDTGAITIPGYSDGDADQSFSPISAARAAKNYTVEKDSDMGKNLGLTTDLSVSPDKFLEYSSQLATKKAVADQKAAIGQALDQQAAQLSQQATTRFSPTYYENLYGKGNVDPNMADHLTAFQNRIKDALTIDKSRGNTEAIQQVGKDLDGNWQSPWEKGMQQRQNKEHELTLARISNKMAQDDKYPEPSDQEINAGVASYKQNGVKVLTALHGINPRLAIAVEQAGAKQGLNPSVLSNEEMNNSAKSKIALDQLQQAENLLTQPGVAGTIGPVLSRYKAFMAGDVGKSQDLRVKSIQDKLSLARQVLGNIHYSARGSANVNVQAALKTLFDGDKMDLPTLLNGMHNVRGILQDYAQEGQVAPLDSLGLGSTGTDLQFKGTK